MTRLRAAAAGKGLLVGILGALLVAALAVILVLAIGEDPERPLERASSGPLVTQQDLSAVQGESGETLLRWWQLIQFQAPLAEVQSYYARSAEVETPTLRRQLTVLRYLFQEAKPRVVQVEESGSQATVLTVIARRQQDVPQYFKLVREGSRWKLADNRYLNRLAAAEQAARRQAERTP